MSFSVLGLKAWVIALVTGAFAFLYGEVFYELYQDWMNDENYAHGILVVPISIYLAWNRRADLAQLTPKPSWFGAVVVAASLGVLMVGTAGIEYFLSRVSMIGVIAGATIFLFGWPYFRVLAFPLAFLILMIPLPAIVFNQIAFPLQLVATRFGVGALELVDIPVLREGNIIVLANTTLEVAEACSGIRSLVSLLTLSTLYGYIAHRHLPGRIMLALSAVPIAIFANGVRVAGAGVAAHYYGPETATGFLHAFSGWLLFTTSLVLVAGIAKIINALPPERRRGATPPQVLVTQS
jgi:exosortase A